jgi:beta-mannosidase
MISVLPIAEGWTVECTACSSAAVPAGVIGTRFASEVPGCVHYDLIRAGVLVPVDEGDGEAQQVWVGHADWMWRGTIEVSADALTEECCELVFASIDTIASVTVNGIEVGTAANQFVQHRFAAKRALRVGVNEITVAIRAPVDWVAAQERLLGARPVNGDWTPYPFMRKSACNFGWDWGPRVPTSGIPGSVQLECWSGVRLAAVRPLVAHCDGARATVEVHVRVERSTATIDGLPSHASSAEIAPLKVMARCELRMPPRSSAPAEDDRKEKRAKLPSKIVVYVPVHADGTGIAIIDVERPDRWWPRGIGRQPLHALHVELVPGPGSEAEWPVRGAKERIVRKIGLRTCELDTAADEHGSQFTFRVNGVAVPVTGANWIPATLFPCATRDDRTVERLIDLAAAANLNMLRVWGGGIYEHDCFYEHCDEIGMLVWQDFMFACATYPEDAPMVASVEREAQQQVERLASHPSIVLWCGGNEDVLAWQSWGFRERLAPGQSWGIGYWAELLPRICADLDPTRPYWVDSPWSGSLDVHANDPDHGDRHTWDLKLDGYRSMVPRFTSEFGHQGPANMQSLREALGDAALAIGSPALTLRQRATGGDAPQYATYMEAAFRPARDFSEWHWQAQLLQARAMETAITWLRAHPERSSGSLFWQLNDVWTGHSWSIIDGKMRPKPAYHAVRRAAAPKLVTIQPVGVADASGVHALRVVLVNDTVSRWNAHVIVRRIDVHGKIIAQAQERIVVLPRSVDMSLEVQDLVGAPDDAIAEGIVVDVPSQDDAIGEEIPLADRDRMRAWWWFAADRDQPETNPAFAITTGRSVSDLWIQVHAQTLVRDLWIEPECDWTECSPNLVSLLPGERLNMVLKVRGGSGEAPTFRIHAH